MCAVCMKWGMGSFSLATSICTYTYMIIRIICVHLVNKGGDGPFHLGYICICVFLYHSICPISAYDYIINVCQSCVYLMHESDIELFLLRYMYILLHHTIYIICAPCEWRVWWALSSWRRTASCTRLAPLFYLQIFPQNIYILSIYVCVCMTWRNGPYAWHDVLLYMCAWLCQPCMCHTPDVPRLLPYQSQDSLSLCATQVIHPYVWHDLLVRIHVMTHSSGQCVPWSNHVCIALSL